MPNDYFQFKQFIIWQHRCAMKVGTDGVLLGAWTDVQRAKYILDIGTGTGLIALMLAQRSKAYIDAIEIDRDAAMQAEENVRISPWSERIQIFHTSFQEFSRENKKYDLIVTNPPYFNDSLKAADEKRSLARHNNKLSQGSLLEGVCELLGKEGSFALIIPADIFSSFSKLVNHFQLFSYRQTNVFGKKNNPCIRILTQFKRTPANNQVTDLIIESGGRHQYSSQFTDLTKEYYLNF
jgi:tRNA1Val (adenine37-N6)-methyltransferase